ARSSRSLPSPPCAGSSRACAPRPRNPHYVSARIPALTRSGVYGTVLWLFFFKQKTAYEIADGTTAAAGSPAPHGGWSGRLISTDTTSGTSGNVRIGYDFQSTLVTRERSHLSSSLSVRLPVWMTLPSICALTPSGLMTSPPSWATTTRMTRIAPP